LGSFDGLAGYDPAVEPLAHFAELVQRPEPEVPLDEAALWLAAGDHPVDVAGRLAQLDDLADAVPDSSVDRLCRHLFVAEGFAGNTEDYYDPANSHLDEVLDRRLGIPITLAVVLMEVGRRAGVVIEGVNAPGHFIVRSEGRLLDPFAGGREVPETDAATAPTAGAHVILARMLANLKAVHIQRGDVTRLRQVLRFRTVVPGVPESDRAELHRLEAGTN
jgi:regulator of sirC expression with transglutaminase-like and TPR domain